MPVKPRLSVSELFKKLDELNPGIDQGIERTLFAFWLHGFETSGSCCGHINWGSCYPWLHITVDDDAAQSEIFKRFPILEGRKRTPHERLDIDLMWAKYGNQLTQNLFTLLNGFYSQHKPELFQYSYTPDKLGDTTCRVEPLIAHLAENWAFTPEEEEHILQKSRQELETLTTYMLVKVYGNEASIPVEIQNLPRLTTCSLLSQ